MQGIRVMNRCLNACLWSAPVDAQRKWQDDFELLDNCRNTKQHRMLRTVAYRRDRTDAAVSAQPPLDHIPLKFRKVGFMSSPTPVLSDLQRDDIYQLIWSKPVSRLAVELNIKAHRLARLCDELQIPRPSSAYWALLRMGRFAQKEQLPELDAAAQAEVAAFRNQFFDSPPPSAVPIKQMQPVVSTVVTEKPTRLHELVRTTRDRLRKKDRGNDGILAVDKSCCLDLRVTWDSVDRALKILDTLLKQWESIGGTVRIGRSQYNNSFVTELELEGDSAAIALFETVRRVTIEKKTSYGWTTREYKFEPTGKLTLQIDEYTASQRRTWADGKRQRLEDMLDSFIQGVKAILELNRIRRRDQECVKRQELAVAAVRKVADDREQQRTKWREELLSSIKRWKEAEAIREYLGVLQKKLDSGVLKLADDEGFAEWKKWALSHVNNIDPFSEACDECDVGNQPENRRVSELDLTRACRALVDQLSVADTNGLYSVPREDVTARCNSWSNTEWNEICRVLESLGYDVAGRYQRY